MLSRTTSALRWTGLLLLSAAITAQTSSSQENKPPAEHHDHDMHDMSTMSMDMPGMQGMMQMRQATNLIESQLNHLSSGTTSEPASTPMYMLMGHHGAWMWMLHGEAFVTDIQQQAAQTPEGRRGGDKLFSTNWVMPMAMRRLGPGQLTLRTMFSLEPATITARQYPLLFQQGETAFGKPIIDGQHPHNFFMEVAALYDIKLSERTLLSFYVAPIGDPAIGPSAYPHRMSASENPLAALGHHQEDSTHIAYNVITTGLTWRWARIEGSGFHGGEPGEDRWQFQPSENGLAIDSYSTRITIAPNANWSGQYSIAHIANPEPGAHETQQRQTASIMYNRPFGPRDANELSTGNWSNTLVWGRTSSHGKLNSYLAESLLKFANKNYVWTRIENAARTNQLLLTPGKPVPPDFEEEPIGHVAAFSFGYDRDFRIGRHITAAPGAQFTTYNTPQALQTTYGDHPWGVAAFLRFRIAQ
ncbi:hypothetical protein [Edaphobacter flagellatus]|uniref:hypothetical protein n=1 Tax=Edaphobacter flagellatus TaxID=1933044 RepID=UPI0021B35BAA|nr:hypothetical protein [Edaphobacter flagellatus]